MSPVLVRLSISAIAVLICVAAEWFSPPQVSVFANEWIRDAFIRLRPAPPTDPRILIVDIDETSLSKVGKWPWPRERMVDLIEVLLSYGAKGVALDIVFDKPLDRAGDARLALLAENGPLVLAQVFDFIRERPQPLREGKTAGASSIYRGGVAASGYMANHPGLAGAAHVGSIGFVPDPDGKLRKVPLLTMFEGRTYPALTVALMNCCSGQVPVRIDEPFFRLPYTRDWLEFNIATAEEILDQRIYIGDIKDRYVLVGSSALGLGDRVATPYGPNRPGLGVHASLLSTLLDHQAGNLPTPWPGRWIAVAFAALTAAFIFVATPRLSAMWCVGMLGVASVAWLIIAFFVTPHDPDFSTTAPLATNLFLLAVAVPYQWQQTQRRSRHLLDTLRQYVAPKVVDQLLESDDENPLKPRQLDVTTLIADMEGYTTQVESLPVQEAAELTRVFLDCLTGPVIDKGGTLDKYTGDGLVAFWGAPLPIEDHADLALEAAREITRQVNALSAKRQALGYPPLRVRIGIESGVAMAGDFGTSFRSIYTAVGDSVNTASRLEQAARDFPHNVIIGAGTVERARRHSFLLLGERLLRGKEKATTLYSFAEETGSSA
jgi:adenylate cyclase